MKMCDHEGCMNEATCLPRVSFTALCAPGSSRARLVMGIPLCAEHAVSKTDLYLDGNAWAELTRLLCDEGLAAPDPASAEIDFVEMPERFGNDGEGFSASLPAVQ